jgi:hypothetical protein
MVKTIAKSIICIGNEILFIKSTSGHLDAGLKNKLCNFQVIFLIKCKELCKKVQISFLTSHLRDTECSKEILFTLPLFAIKCATFVVISKLLTPLLIHLDYNFIILHVSLPPLVQHYVPIRKEFS